MVIFLVQERLQQFWRIRNEGLRVLVYGRNSPYGILPNIGMPMVEAGPSGGNKGFEQLGFSQFAEESECIAANILVGMLQIISDTIASNVNVSRMTAEIH